MIWGVPITSREIKVGNLFLNLKFWHFSRYFLGHGIFWEKASALNFEVTSWFKIFEILFDSILLSGPRNIKYSFETFSKPLDLAWPIPVPSSLIRISEEDWL